jgi:hypothetical protein
MMMTNAPESDVPMASIREKAKEECKQEEIKFFMNMRLKWTEELSEVLPDHQHHHKDKELRGHLQKEQLDDLKDVIQIKDTADGTCLVWNCLIRSL